MKTIMMHSVKHPTTMTDRRGRAPLGRRRRKTSHDAKRK
jgi:hypothetical protein